MNSNTNRSTQIGAPKRPSKRGEVENGDAGTFASSQNSTEKYIRTPHSEDELVQNMPWQRNATWKRRFNLQAQLNDNLRQRFDDLEKRHERLLCFIGSHIETCENSNTRTLLGDVLKREQQRNADRLMRHVEQIEGQICSDIRMLDLELQHKHKCVALSTTVLNELLPAHSGDGDFMPNEEQLLVAEINRLDNMLRKTTQKTQRK